MRTHTGLMAAMTGVYVETLKYLALRDVLAVPERARVAKARKAAEKTPAWLSSTAFARGVLLAGVCLVLYWTYGWYKALTANGDKIINDAVWDYVIHGNSHALPGWGPAADRRLLSPTGVGNDSAATWNASVCPVPEVTPPFARRLAAAYTWHIDVHSEGHPSAAAWAELDDIWGRWNATWEEWGALSAAVPRGRRLSEAEACDAMHARARVLGVFEDTVSDAFMWLVRHLFEWFTRVLVALLWCLWTITGFLWEYVFRPVIVVVFKAVGLDFDTCVQVALIVFGVYVAGTLWWYFIVPAALAPTLVLAILRRCAPSCKRSTTADEAAIASATLVVDMAILDFVSDATGAGGAALVHAHRALEAINDSLVAGSATIDSVLMAIDADADVMAKLRSARPVIAGGPVPVPVPAPAPAGSIAVAKLARGAAPHVVVPMALPIPAAEVWGPPGRLSRGVWRIRSWWDALLGVARPRDPAADAIALLADRDE